MTGPWLSIVGLGEDGLEGLSPAARALVDSAEVLVGGERHLAMLPPETDGDGRERLTWPRPLFDLLPVLEARRGRPVCVLATGDPLCYGIGTTLLRRFAPDECLILPAVSAFSLACARLGWTLDRVETLTLHGRPLELVLARLYPGARLLALSDGAETPARIAALLADRGLGAARLVALEHLGGPKEGRVEATAVGWGDRPVAALNTLAIEIPADAELPAASRLAGLPDEAFLGDGQMTKREVRAATLAALAPWPGALLWDVGAGCGSVAVEWLRSDPRCRAVAVERKAGRIAMIAANAAALGVPTLKVVSGEAPAALAGLDREGRERPDAVFLGGGLDTPGLFEACWAALRPGGRLVANVVTLEGEARVLALRAAHGGQLSRIAVSRAEPVGPFHGWRPLMAVTQWAVAKPREEA
ncbi:precorrin-6Y C5,15-methyltransferase (decarboxylating) [Tistlia consotensis]|uniref:Precorrin-6Y C5,15-methyltransferase (Decarboxylating) n=1 Tax=Tistlia consotensis USBA 355 TaxID=560819 RepID=A0A1Y6BA93_9PROT|nr:precorrin-6y C5,15-methyltransferase (decarboxylating) subunit CbiE [Tistlia consotensis]SME93019.1 precorrin-6Y C5,15-methyltransferase (decarboxylating) [Tistlia consotensis USBA 355]SNR28400.1 precorrin-6Y C5,15-methyltransferase (decarboxylating) [Tistlia consotensis]